MLQSILFLDLETGRDGTRIWELGAVFGDRPPISTAGVAVKDALLELRSWIDEADLVCGHNALAHDFPILARLGSVEVPSAKQVDTLMLSPLAFPKKPYHALVKEGKLVSASKNDPVADAICCRKVLEECLREFAVLPDRERALYIAAFELAGQLGGASVLRHSGGRLEPMVPTNPNAFLAAFREMNVGRCCLEQLPPMDEPDHFLVLAYIHAWLNVAGSDSVLPFWLCHRFPAIRRILHGLRARHCGDARCVYCNKTHSPEAALRRIFGFPSFRPVPTVPGEPDESLQKRIVSTAFDGQSSLSILPTGGGKSICFQIPAIHRYQCTGALSIVISPLQSLMKDQVENLRNRVGVLHCNALYGLLTPLERKACLDDLRTGGTGLIYVAPEQLRSPAFRKAISKREIALWIFDEAHCLSKWGHDFRPDYLYAAKFIKALAEEQGVAVPQVMALTATAKQDVKDDILAHFHAELGLRLALHDGGTERSNLQYTVEKVETPAKFERLLEILADHYGEVPDYEGRGSVVIFAPTRWQTHEFADRLCAAGWNAATFNAGLEIEEKKSILERFMDGTVKIIVSTNAFGMGVDKPDIRLVIHLGAPGSLENYLQEAGRAGRDGDPAACILLYDDSDLEMQFKMTAFSKVSQKDIQMVWKAIRSAKPDSHGAIVLTVDEILSAGGAGFTFEDEQRSQVNTKVKTAVALLERQDFLERKENRSRVFQASALVKSIEEAEIRIDALHLPERRKALWLAMMSVFFDLPDNESSDIRDFAQIAEVQMVFEEAKKENPRISVNVVVFRILNEMASPNAGLLKKDLLFTALLKGGSRGALARKALNQLAQLERAFIDLLQEEEPDAEGTCSLSLRLANEALCRRGLSSHVETLGRTVKTLCDDWPKLRRGVPGLEAKHVSAGRVQLRLRANLAEVQALAAVRRDLAGLILDLLITKAKGTEAAVPISFSESELVKSVQDDIARLDTQFRSLPEALHHTLLWMHHGRVIELQQGKSLITSAMTLYLKDHKRGRNARRFTKGDFEPLAHYYREKIIQIHIVGEYARKALEALGTHLHFTAEYFRMVGEEFVRRYFAGRKKELRLATGIESYKKIYESLANPLQQAVVAAEEDKNMLVLAGPGSGKTRVIVHRCAWLLRVMRVRPQGIIILCFNRHAALEIRRRLWALVGRDAAAVTVQTFHGLALKLLGRTMAELEYEDGDARLDFKTLIPAANRLLSGEDVPIGMDAEAFRSRLIGSLTHILVDEYQDIGPEAYELVSLLAGKARTANEDKLTILAVGDDDQSIYGYAGANVDFIRRYEEDYPNRARGSQADYMPRHYLVENYRSTKYIIAASNRLIFRNHDRMKLEHPIREDRARENEAEGGIMEKLDPLSQGRVQILPVRDVAEQAQACLAELQRLKALSPDFRWSDCCIFSRNNKGLDRVRYLFEQADIPVLLLGEERMPRLSRVHLVYRWLAYLSAHPEARWTGEELYAKLDEFVAGQGDHDPFGDLLKTLARVFYGETGGLRQPVGAIHDFFLESCSERELPVEVDAVRLSTVHKAKGLEFGFVFLLDGGWNPEAPVPAKREEERRVFYVGMTRAKHLLSVFQIGEAHRYIEDLGGPDVYRREPVQIAAQVDLPDVEYRVLGLGDCWIDFGGTRPEGAQSLAAIDALSPRDCLDLTVEGEGGLALRNEARTIVGWLAKQAEEEWRGLRARIIHIRVIGLHVRKASDGEQPGKGETQRPHRGLRRETWSVPICEVVLRDSRPS